jgi:hypothetical protein
VLGETIACSPTPDGRTPASVIDQVNQRLAQVDPTRPTYCQYTKPVAELQGLTTTQAAAYVNAACGIVSYDSYIISDGWSSNHDLWRQYDDVQRVRSLAGNGVPVFPFLEAGEPFYSTTYCGAGQTNSWSHITPTPAMEVAEAWHAVIGGARGIQWFDHTFGCGAGGYPNSGATLIDSNSAYAPLQAAVKAFDQEITALAPIINDPFADSYVTSTKSTGTGTMNEMVKYDAATKNFYLFAGPRFNDNENVTYTVAGGYSGPVTVYGENRTVTATNGSFTDAVNGQTAVHVYVIPNNA